MGATATQAKAKHELVEKAEHLSHYSIEIKEQYKPCTTKEAKYHWKKFTEQLKMKKKYRSVLSAVTAKEFRCNQKNFNITPVKPKNGSKQ